MNEQDREAMILDNIPLVYTYVGRMKLPRLKEDLVQAGTLGLIRAVDTFDPDKGAFSTHAFWHIRNQITLFLNTLDLVKIPRYAYKDSPKHHYGEFREPIPDEKEHNPGSWNEPSTVWERDLLDKLLDDKFPALTKAGDDELFNLVRLLVEDLPFYERNLIKGRYGIGGPTMTLPEMAHRHKTYKQIIDQDLRRAEKKLLRALARYDINNLSILD